MWVENFLIKRLVSLVPDFIVLYFCRFVEQNSLSLNLWVLLLIVLVRLWGGGNNSFEPTWPSTWDLFKWGRSDWGKIWWLKKSRSAGEILVGLPAVEPCGFTRPNTNSGSCLWRGSGSTCLSVGFEFGCQIHTRLWKDSDSVELRSAETCKDIFLRPLVAIDFLINQVPESLPLHMKTCKRVLEAPHCSFLFLSLLISVCSWFFLFFLVQGRTLLKREIGLHGVWTL